MTVTVGEDGFAIALGGALGFVDFGLVLNYSPQRTLYLRRKR